MKNLFLLGALLIPTIVYSANDLERWNSEVGRTVRQTHSDKLAQTTYTEISSKNVNVSHGSVSTVYFKTYFKSLDLIFLWPFESCIVHILRYNIVHNYLRFSSTLCSVFAVF